LVKGQSRSPFPFYGRFPTCYCGTGDRPFGPCGELELRNTTVSENAGTASGPTGEAQGGGIWNGAFDPTSPSPELTLLASALTHNSLAASSGITPQGGGLFTTVPVTLDDSVIASNSPDQCFGC
jgi:hypothetical protein